MIAFSLVTFSGATTISEVANDAGDIYQYVYTQAQIFFSLFSSLFAAYQHIPGYIIFLQT